MNEWMSVLLTIIMNTFSVLSIILIMKLFFGIGISQRYYWKIGAVFAGVHLFIEILFHIIFWINSRIVTPTGDSVLYTLYEVVSFVWILFFIILVAFYFVKHHRWLILLYTVSALCLYSQYDMLMLSLMEQLKIIQWDIHLGESSVLSMLETMLIFVMLAAFIYILERKHPLIPFDTGGIVFLSVFSIFSPALLSVLEVIEDALQNDRFTVVCLLFMFVLNGAVFYGIFYYQDAKYYKTLSKDYKQQFDSEYAYLKDYKAKQQEIIRFRHDWNNHMLILQSMFERKEYEKARKYFASLSKKSIKSSVRTLTGNEMVDMILNIKTERMQQEDICVSCDGSLAALGFMEPMDCCILFANLIDNAIEANESYTGTRYIKFRIVQHPGTLMIKVENPTDKQVYRKADALHSTKQDNKEHGIGTMNAFEIIRKYHGDYSIMTDTDYFAIQILFPLET